MDLITSFALGDDVAILLLAVGALSLAVLVATGLVLWRWARAEDEDAAAIAPGPWLASLLNAAISLALWAGVPTLLASLLIVDGLTDRLLRAAMILLGLALGGVSAWLGQRLLAAARRIDPADAPAAAVRVGGLLAAAAVSLAALPAVVAVWFLHEAAGQMLLALAAGAAISALAVRIVAAIAESAGSSATLLAGAHELELDRESGENLAAGPLAEAELMRHGAGRSAQITAVAAAAVGAAAVVGVPVLATEGLVVTILGIGVAIAAPLIGIAIPLRGAPGREGAAFRLGGLVPALIAGAGAVAATALWLPAQYQSLRFAAVGMENFTDPAITGGTATPRADLLEQIQSAVADIGSYIAATDESRDASALMDVIALYGTHPNTLVAISIALGAVLAVCAQLLISAHAAPAGEAALRTARTARTGAALGFLAALGSGAVWAGLILSVLALALVVIGVLAAGVPMLALALTAFAALGALIAVAAQGAAHAASVLVDRPGADDDWRVLVRSRADEGPVGLAIVAALAATALIAPVAAAVQAAGRASSVWEDRFLHALTPTSLSVVSGVGLGLVTCLAIGAFLLDGQRRLSAAAVLEARTAHLEERTEVSFAGMGLDARRAGLVVIAAAVLMPVVAGFGLGPAAVPGYLAGLVMTGIGLSLWAHAASGPLAAAVPLIEEGRYGGRGSWAHGGALTGAVLGTSLRAALGELLVPAVLVSALTAYLGITMIVGLVADGVSVYLRAGIVVVALLVGLCCWLYARTAPEPDLEDADAITSRPLFATRVEEDAEGGLVEMSWDADEDGDDEVDEDAKPARKAVPASKRPRRKG